MNQKKWINIITPMVIVAALVGAIALIVLKGSAKEDLEDRYSNAPELTGAVNPDEDTVLLSKGGYSLYLEDNMVVRIVSADGTVWSTNGLSHDGKETVNQFKVSYYTSNAAYSYMESQADSVDKDQAEAFLEDDTLYVRYRLGSYGRTVDHVPSYMTNARFQEKFLDQLSEAEVEEITAYYKHYKEDDVWRIRSKGRNNFERILELMDQVGYTEEDLVMDNASGGITTDVGSKPWFTIVLAYQLTDQGLSVSMPVERIEFNKDYPLYEVELLPHFGKLEQDTEGYVLLPDGSGALMPFVTDYATRVEYTIPIYGLDWAVASDTLSTGQYQYEYASLPVFGMKDGTAAYLAVIESGASKATLHFHQAGSYFERNTVYPTFRMVNKDSVYLSGSDNSSKVIVFESSLAEETCAVHYQFLPENSGYVEMAAAYRSQLEDAGILTDLGEDATVSMLLETICGVMSNKNLLGISYEGIEAATTYEQNVLLAEDLLESGVEDLDLKLIGWFNGGVYHDYAGSVSLNRVLGGKAGWEKLLAYAEQADVQLYPDVDLQRIPAMDWGFVPTMDSASRLDSNEARFSILSRALLLEKEDIGLTPSSLYLLSPGKFEEVAKSFLKDFEKIQTAGLSLRSVWAYSDFNDEDMISRPEAVELLQKQLELLSSKQELMVENGGLYSYAYTQKLSGVPTDCSHYRIADETVPFLQLVLHGSVKMYTTPINLASNSGTAVLKAIEYGVLPNYQVTYADSSILKNSEYSDNYASGYSGWRTDILESYAMISESLQGLVGCSMVNHEQVADQVYAVTYSDGTVVYVNYNETNMTVDGVTVPARGFIRK